VSESQAQLTERSLQVLHVVTAWWRQADPGLRAAGLHEGKVAALLSASDKETGRVTEEIRGILKGLAAADLIVYVAPETGEGQVCIPTEKALTLTEGQQSLQHRPPGDVT
jgi:hypothetical protein